MASRKITWSKQAINQFNKAINYIATNSIQNAEKVRTEVLEKINNHFENPEINSPDKLRKNNDGSYRVFELHRVAYHVSAIQIRILRYVILVGSQKFIKFFLYFTYFYLS